MIDLRHGDCRDLVAGLQADSVDSCVTDPPYALTSGKRGRSGLASPGSRTTAGGVMGKKWDTGEVAFDPAFWSEILRVLKPGAHLLSFGGTRTYHRMVCAIEDAGFEIRDQVQWIYGSGFPKSHNLADEWDGWGTALKPAHEPIVLARKPLIGTVAENVARHRTGAINIDGCRIDAGDALGGEYTVKRLKPGATLNRTGGNWRPEEGPEYCGTMKPGRWPANVVHDGSDEVLAAFPDAPGQMADASLDPNPRRNQNVYGCLRAGRAGEQSADDPNNGRVGFKMRQGVRRDDSGSAARFFYCAKASNADRDDGLAEFEVRPHVVFATANGTSGKPSSISKGRDTRRSNTHPTVKPTDLMRWLCRLVTPPGGLVLDPFAGSGSTGRGAVLGGFSFLGFEREAEYIAVATARIAAAEAEYAEATRQGSFDLSQSAAAPV